MASSLAVKKVLASGLVLLHHQYQMATNEASWGHYRLTEINHEAVKAIALSTSRKLNAVVNLAVEQFARSHPSDLRRGVHLLKQQQNERNKHVISSKRQGRR